MSARKRHTLPLRLVLLLLALAPLAGVRADPPKDYRFVAYDEGLRVAQRDGKRVFVYFGRLGCGYCDKTNKESFSDADVRARYSANYVLVYVDAESGKRLHLPSGETITEMELGAQLKTLVTPYFLYLEPNGALIYKVPGFQTAQSLKEYDSYIHGGHYKNKTLAQFLAGHKN